MIRRVTDNARGLIEQWEGLRLTAYTDSVGVWTVGYGHTGPEVHKGYTITAPQADQLLTNDLAGSEQAVSSLVNVNLNDNQFGALVSFAFNLGAGALQSSTLLKRINKGDFDVANEFLKWDHGHVHGHLVEIPGLKTRRKAEAKLFAS
ncbi:lysozyme [Mesorhizobium sp. B1-1-8]|uniref:lysozyme n=1 Tax=Mesorhizobium sp. B1-1-8 TaxID=2589976 RepID=UPI00112D15B8|nr:lysozyme [Mesorhizobium sp. B1-1-8]UCI07364.1 lysozyme [Mesorhizobium sp. B1-1-8]